MRGAGAQDGGSPPASGYYSALSLHTRASGTPKCDSNTPSPRTPVVQAGSPFAQPWPSRAADGGGGGGGGWPWAGLQLRPALARLPARLPPPALLVCAALWLAFVSCYWASLKGARKAMGATFITTPTFRRVVVLLPLAVVAFSMAMWLAAWCLQPGPRAGTWGALGAANLALLAYSHGANFKDHGIYNWAAFWVIFFPLNLPVLGLWALWQALRPRQFLCTVGAIGLGLGLAVHVSLLHKEQQWVRGLAGRSMIPGCPGGQCDTPYCNFPRHATWIDLLPARAQNWWAGPQRCKPVEGFEATFSQEGLLTINCDGGQGAAYSVFADTRDWGIEYREVEEMPYEVLRRMEDASYTGPVRLESAEAVLARCGGEEKLLVRAARFPPAQLRPANDSLALAAAGADARRERPNVLVVLIDALSRRHFFRRLQRTAAAVEAIAAGNTTQLYQFFRFHSVGLNTGFNTPPIYSGVPKVESRNAQTIFESYRLAGYSVGWTSNFCQGWGARYNGAATRVDNELIAPFCLKEYQPRNRPSRVYQGPYSITRRCLRGRHVHQYNFDYQRSFMTAYAGSGRPWFFINMLNEAHEPSGEVVHTIDDTLADFLLGMAPSELNNTVVMLLADHGLHMGLNFLYTTNGDVEHANPFLAMLAPAWLARRHPEAFAELAKNEQKLIAGYDLFTTFHHLLHLWEQPPGAAPPREGTLARWAAEGGVKAGVHWGTSLLAPIPAGRTCQHAEIPKKYCFCRQRHQPMRHAEHMLLGGFTSVPLWLVGLLVVGSVLPYALLNLRWLRQAGA